jgi:N-acetylglucosamine-6-phosphate deacetylase
VVSINSDDAAEATHLNQEAAKSMKFGGLTHDEALKLVTINPAIQLGMTSASAPSKSARTPTWSSTITILSALTPLCKKP